ncbi:MAG: glycosyltransferase family 2 protein, partial [Bacteroidetes bacterium]|nr:glycosyltransferase family 2 protein [Bacteroidota bacterium]
MAAQIPASHRKAGVSVIKLSIVIVSYNVKTFLQQTLESVYEAASDIECEIFVVDNRSLDGSAEMVESKFPEVILIRNDKNLGFAKANNLAIDKSDGDFILLLNPDTVVQEDTFSVLMEFFETHPKAGAAGCKVLNADGTLQPACRRSSPTPMVVLPKILGLNHLFPKSKIFGKYNLTYLDEDELSEVDAVSGSCVMVRKEVIEKVGTLDEDFFMFGEDLDWFYRMRIAGHKIYYVPHTKIIHYKGESIRAAGYDAIGMFYKAQIQFVRKHFSKSKSLFAVMFLYFAIVLRGLLSYAVKTGVSLAPLMMDTVLMQLSLLLAI